MGNVKNRLKNLETEVRADIARYAGGGLSSFSKGDRRALIAGGAIGAVVSASSVYADVAGDLSGTFNTLWEQGLKISWGIAAIMALIALAWTLISGSKEVSKPLAWLRRIVFVVIGMNFIITVIEYAKGLNKNDKTPSSIMN